MDIQGYLERIEVSGPLPPTVGTLRRLQRAHMLHIPFESYDCALGRPVVVDPEVNFEKIVGRHRGGYCFELNGPFSRLLEALGFEVTLLSARPFTVGKEAEAEPEFSHLALMVPVDGERWLVDVGFGDGSLEPLRLDPPRDAAATDSSHFRINPGDGDQPWSKVQVDGHGDAESYLFSLVPRRIEDFAGMCHYYSTSPDSWFVTSPVCTMATETGRVTLFQHRRLITTENGVRTERALADDTEERAILRDVFGVVLD
jgi:N-hydroxyarylamine O-acetyltransferase